MSGGQKTGGNRLRKFHAARWSEPVAKISVKRCRAGPAASAGSSG